MWWRFDLHSRKVIFILLTFLICTQVYGQDPDTENDTLSQSTSVGDSTSNDRGYFADLMILVNYRDNDSTSSFGGTLIWGGTVGKRGYFGLGIGYQNNRPYERQWTSYLHIRTHAPLHLRHLYFYIDFGLTSGVGVGLIIPSDKVPQWSLQAGYARDSFQNECKKLLFVDHYLLSIGYRFDL